MNRQSGDSLRDRIAAVILAHPDRMDGRCHDPSVDEMFTHQDEWAAHLADAVIAALLDMPLADWIALIASRPDVLKESRR